MFSILIEFFVYCIPQMLRYLFLLYKIEFKFWQILFLGKNFNSCWNVEQMLNLQKGYWYLCCAPMSITLALTKALTVDLNWMDKYLLMVTQGLFKWPWGKNLICHISSEQIFGCMWFCLHYKKNKNKRPATYHPFYMLCSIQIVYCDWIFTVSFETA